MKKNPTRCATRWCRNPRAVNNTGRRLRKCWKCRSRLLRERHPITYVFNALRNSARSRKIEFTLTREEFEGWCKETGYMEKRGTKPDSMTVGRIDHSKGYHIWNIQPESHMTNSWKGRYVPVLEVWAAGEEMW